MKAIQPNPENARLDEFDEAMSATADRAFFLRLFAMRMLFQGIDRHIVLLSMKINRKTLTRWIHLWNIGGIDTLATTPRCGRPPVIPLEAFEKIRPHLDPDYDDEYEVWTAKKAHGYLVGELKVQCGYSTVVHTLHRQNYAVKTPRPWSVKQDEKARANYRYTMERLEQRDDLDVWFCDESGFLADPRPRRHWAKKGTTPTSPITGLHLRANVVGAVQSKTGELHAFVFDRMETSRFQCFLDEMAKQTKGRKTILVLDNATWHRAVALEWNHIQPLFLPAYSPDLNPIERLWLVMKDRFFNNWYTDTYEALEERVCEALLAMMENETEVASICA